VKGLVGSVVANMMAWSAATAIRMPKRHGHTGTHPLREAADVLGRLEIPAGALESPEAEKSRAAVKV